MTRTRVALVVAGLGLIAAANQSWLVREYGFVGYISLVSLAVVVLAGSAIAFRRR